jgi:hypothetical protein
MIKISNNLVKLANNAQEALSFIDNTQHHVNKMINQTTYPLEKGLIGAGIGGLSGAGLAALIEQFKAEKDRQYLKSMLIGGGVGAGLGGLLGAGPDLMRRQQAKGTVDAVGGTLKAIIEASERQNAISNRNPHLLF